MKGHKSDLKAHPLLPLAKLCACVWECPPRKRRVFVYFPHAEKIHFCNLIRGGWYHWRTTYCLPPIKQSFDMWFLKSFYPVTEVGITTLYFRLPHQSNCWRYNTKISICRQTHKIDMSPRWPLYVQFQLLPWVIGKCTCMCVFVCVCVSKSGEVRTGGVSSPYKWV